MMALQTLFQLGETTNRCLFTTVKHYKHTSNPFKDFRGFRRKRSAAKNGNVSFPSEHIESGPLSFSKMWKPFGFTIMFSGAAFVGVAIWEYERIRKHTYSFINHYRPYRIHKTGWRGEMEAWWKGLTDGQKLFVPICFLNVLVFFAWHIPAFQGTMVRNFCANPSASKLCWPMVLSTFSHYSLFHLAANMYVLHSFITPAVTTLGREQLLGLYLTSGIVSSFASYMYKATVRVPGLSLGASGAIMGVLGFVCTQYPDTRLNIIFLPMYTFTAGVAIKVIMGLELAGCALGWKYFDHAAHLGGVLFGMFWQAWGNAYIWQKREPILTFWHELRKPPRSP